MAWKNWTSWRWAIRHRLSTERPPGACRDGAATGGAGVCARLAPAYSRLCWLLLVWCLACRPAAAAGPHAMVRAPVVDVYTIDLNSSKTAYSQNHISTLLTAALDASTDKYGPYRLQTSPIRMERDRLLTEMRQGALVNLSAQVTSAEWERDLLPIRIPIDKGISGYRIALIDGRRQADFSALRTLAQLKAVPMGAGRQWSSTAVFQQAGFNVVPGNSTAGLHGMLAAGRFRYFPRSVDEAVFERDEYVGGFPALDIESSMTVYFPLPRYFFVAPSQPRLAQRLEYGLNRLIADGRFDQIFHQFYDGLIERIGLRHRRVFKIDNPTLSPATPLDRKSYWYDPV